MWETLKTPSKREWNNTSKMWIKRYIMKKMDTFAVHVAQHFNQKLTPQHRWELPGNCPVFTMVMVIFHYVEIIWRTLVTPHFLMK